MGLYGEFTAGTSHSGGKPATVCKNSSHLRGINCDVAIPFSFALLASSPPVLQSKPRRTDNSIHEVTRSHARSVVCSFVPLFASRLFTGSKRVCALRAGCCVVLVTPLPLTEISKRRRGAHSLFRHFRRQNPKLHSGSEAPTAFTTTKSQARCLQPPQLSPQKSEQLRSLHSIHSFHSSTRSWLAFWLPTGFA